jgi:hypothetical protein
MKKGLIVFFILLLSFLSACSSTVASNTVSRVTLVPATATSLTTSTNQTIVENTSSLTTTFENASPVVQQLFYGLLKLEGTDLSITPEQAATLTPPWQNYLTLIQSQAPAGAGSQPDTITSEANNQPPAMPTIDPALQSQMDELLDQIQSILTTDQIQSISAMHITPDSATTIAQELGLNLGNPMGGSSPSSNTPIGQPPVLPDGSDPSSNLQPPTLPANMSTPDQLLPQMVDVLINYLQKVSANETVDLSTIASSTNSIMPAHGGTSTSNGLASTASGAYTLDASTETQEGNSYNTSTDDQSAILATNGASLTLKNATISSSGNSSSSDNSSFYGLNAAVLANSASRIDISDSTVASSGAGANGVFAEGSGTSINLTDVTITATGQYAHGVMATNGGELTLTNVDMTTSGANSGVIATDRGSGAITVTGGTVIAQGQDSPGIYSTGNISVTDATISSTGAESAVIEGANSISLTNTSLTSSKAEKWGVMIYQSMSGDAEGTQGEFSMSGGSLSNTAATGPLFYVTNSTAMITLKGVNLEAASGVLVNAAAGNWGNSGSNGGTVNLETENQNLDGEMIADEISSINLTLQNTSIWTGAMNQANTARSANISLDASSQWIVTADSFITTITDPDGINETTISNIVGNGHTIYYDPEANPSLNNLTFTLSGGGFLKPVE